MEDSTTARLKKLVADSNEALELRLIRNLDDLHSEEAIFKPEMTYQVFGDRFVVIILIYNLLRFMFFINYYVNIRIMHPYPIIYPCYLSNVEQE